MIVVDASVILKWFFPEEEGFEQALGLKKQHVTGEKPIAVPELLFYEAANVLLAKRKESHAVIEAVKELLDLELEAFSLGVSELCQAVELASHYRITVYDASYLSLAQSLKTRFFTADGRLRVRLKDVPNVFPLGQ